MRRVAFGREKNNLLVMSTQTSNGYLVGQMLVAMPQMTDPRFARAVVYICAHSPTGAMGIVVNRAFDGLSFSELLRQLEIESGPGAEHQRVHFGGPVESGRGFVLHSTDFVHETTMKVDDDVALTATVDVLRAISLGQGPHFCFLALGYAGWGPEQLEAEILENAWLTVPSDADLLYSPDLDGKWVRALHKLRVEVSSLSGIAGHA